MNQRRSDSPSEAEDARTTTVSSPQVALSDYLATMLEEATEDLSDESEPASPETPQIEPAYAEHEPAENTGERELDEPSFVESAVDESLSVVETGQNAPEEPAAMTPQIEAAAADALVWESNGRPAWAQSRFDCLLFKVDGLSLAVPMVLLGTIHPLDRELTPLFGQPDWFMGLHTTGARRNIRVVETARLVMPERYRAEARESLRYAVGIHGCDWALAAHEVVGSVTLSPDDVKWRRDRKRRPWLAGTVVDRMCALLDLQALEQTLLRDQVKPQHAGR